MRTTDPDRITAVELSRTADVSRATFYRHYDTVDDVLREIEDEFITGIINCCSAARTQPLTGGHYAAPPQVFVAMTEYILAHKDVYLIMTGTHEDARFLIKWHRFIREFHATMLSQEQIVKNDAALFIELVEAGTDAIIRYWLEKCPEASADEIARVTERLLRGPLMD